MMQNEKKLDPNLEICRNCKYLLWMVGIGQGLKCSNEKNLDSQGNKFCIPASIYTCDFFEHKNNENGKSDD